MKLGEQARHNGHVIGHVVREHLDGSVEVWLNSRGRRVYGKRQTLRVLPVRAPALRAIPPETTIAEPEIKS